MLIEVRESDNIYTVSLPHNRWKDNELWYAGKGETSEEAIGNFIVSNRENLKIVFKFISDDSIKYSTINGRAITKKELKELE